MHLTCCPLGTASPRDLAAIRDTLTEAVRLGLLVATADHVAYAAAADTTTTTRRASNTQQHAGIRPLSYASAVALADDARRVVAAGQRDFDTAGGPTAVAGGDASASLLHAMADVKLDEGVQRVQVLRDCAAALLLPAYNAHHDGDGATTTAGSVSAVDDRFALALAHAELTAALVPQPNFNVNDGGFIADG